MNQFKKINNEVFFTEKTITKIKDEDIKFKIISRSNVNSKMSGPLIIVESTAITYVDVNYDVTRDTDSNLLIVNSEMK